MDHKSVVYNAARDGNLSRLKVYLHGGQGKDEISMLVGARTAGATPLVIACRNGHYDVAEYLIEKCHADIEQPGSVIFDGETIEGAPPLWCAAAAGHLPLVQLLVARGARVNSTTRTNSTPLRAACYDGHFEIVKFLVHKGADIEVANRHGHTCLMIACYKGHIRIAKFLLSLNADVNRKSVKGNTALHDCAESGSLEILKLLLENGAVMDVDSYGMTPLLAASVTGHKHIVEYILDLWFENLTRQERIDALELLGATFVDKKRDMLSAVRMWKRAMMERYPPEVEHIPKPPPAPAVEAYDFVQEVTDPAKLDELLADPDEMRMQALVIRERILGPAHPDTSYYIRYRGAVYADAGRFTRCCSLWHRALDMQRSMLGPLSPMTLSSLYSFAELFSYMAFERTRPPSRGRIIPPVSYEDLSPVLNKGLDELSRGLNLLTLRPPTERDQTVSTLQRVLVVCLHLASLMARLLLTGENTPIDKMVKQDIYALVKMDIKVKHGRSCLHLACMAEGIEGTRGSPGPMVLSALVELLCEVGADPNVRDADGNTALHLAAKCKPCQPEVVKVLLDHGAHLDMINYDGDTFQDILNQSGQGSLNIVNPLKYTTLQCLAARAVKRYRLNYKNMVPRNLYYTIISH